MDSDLLLTILRVTILGTLIAGLVFGHILLFWGIHKSDAKERAHKKQLARVRSPSYQVPRLRLLTDGVDKQLEIDYGDGRGWVNVKKGEYTECLTPYGSQVYNAGAEEAYEKVLQKIEFWRLRESKREVGWRVEREDGPLVAEIRKSSVLRGVNMPGDPQSFERE